MTAGLGGMRHSHGNGGDKSGAREQLRARGARGATLPEYALILALVVVVSLGAIQLIDRTASEESQDLATCVEKRPPDPSCQIPAIATTTTTAGGITTTTVTTPPGPSDTSGWAPAGDDSGLDAPPPGDTWWAEVVLDVTDPGSAPVAGVTVRLRWSFSTGEVVTQFCTTDASGSCTFHVDVNNPTASSVTARVLDITGENTVDPPSGPRTIDKP